MNFSVTLYADQLQEFKQQEYLLAMSYPSNQISREENLKRLSQEKFERITLSFYKYFSLANPIEFRNRLFRDLEKLGALGRIYLASEGINAQISVPEPDWDSFKDFLKSYSEFAGIHINDALDSGKSFFRLTIKIREQIVADDLPEGSYDLSKCGKHLNALEFNQAMENPDVIIIDMRNHYESEVGHFRGALRPDVDTFREELPIIGKELKGQEDRKILMYCTGGIRCEKASAWLIARGFRDVNQLKGGIINYACEIRKKNLPSKFIGKNFVFDERLGERVTEDIIANCHQCGKPCDEHKNCFNDLCHLLFIQCPSCEEHFEGCCSRKCRKIFHLSKTEREKLRDDQSNRKEFKSRLRPHLKVDHIPKSCLNRF